MAITRAMLKKMSHEELVGFAMSAMSKNEEITNNVVAELESVKVKLEAIQSQFSVSSNVNTLLSERVVKLERRCWMNEQYSRRECIEVTGLPVWYSSHVTIFIYTFLLGPTDGYY